MHAAVNTHTLEVFEETRKYPRIKKRLPVKITTDQGQTILCNLYDISSDGIQVRCERETACKIHPGGLTIDRKKDNTVVITFSLPVENEDIKITVTCKIYYVAIVPDNVDEQFAIGLTFKKFEGQTVKYIGRYILDELEQSSAAF